MSELSVPIKKWLHFLWCMVVGHSWSGEGSYQMCWRCEYLSKVGDSPKIDMIISYNRKTHTLWHSDCSVNHAPPMKELSFQEDMTLMECTVCKAQGYYPHGKSGRIKVEQIKRCQCTHLKE